MMNATAERTTPITTTSKRTGEIQVHCTNIAVWEDCPPGRPDVAGMRRTFRAMLARLSARGWKVERDPQKLKNYPRLSDDHWVGSKGDLRVVAETGGRTAKVEFYQEINVENRNGGRYDFDKFARMPRALRMSCIVEMGAVVRKLLDLGYSLDKSVGVRVDALNWTLLQVAEGRRDPTDRLAYFNAGKHWESVKRDETGWLALSEYGHSYNNDRNGVPLRNGDLRYFRLRGRLMRAVVYSNLNTNWLAFYGGSATLVQGNELFACERPDLEPRRLMPGQAKRVRAELEKAVKVGNFKRVAALAKVCEAIPVKKEEG